MKPRPKPKPKPGPYGMTRHSFIWSLLGLSLATPLARLGLRKPKHGDVDGKAYWTSRQFYETKLAHMRRWQVVERGQSVPRVGLPKILRRSAWNDVYLVSEDDIFAYFVQNLRFSDSL